VHGVSLPVASSHSFSIPGWIEPLTTELKHSRVAICTVGDLSKELHSSSSSHHNNAIRLDYPRSLEVSSTVRLVHSYSWPTLEG
jgi:hypothetical protein